MTILTEADEKILPLALRKNGRFDVFCEWYLRGTKLLPWQYAWRQADVMNKTAVCGIATGKTTINAGTLIADALCYPYFRGLNTSVTARQAELAFDKVWGWIEGNDRLEHLIDDMILRPFPTIKFKNYSELQFRTSGTDARFIRGDEFDEIFFDEAGLDFQGGIVKVLRGRLRGSRPDGLGGTVFRLAHLGVSTSPTDAPWLLERFNRGDSTQPQYDPKQFLSFRVPTWANTFLAPEQIDSMKAEYPDEMIDVELGGMFPDYGNSDFPRKHIESCVSIDLLDQVYMAVYPDSGPSKPGFKVEEHPRHGITRFEMQVKPEHRYVLSGDPGSDDLPGRGAGVVIVWDITKKPFEMVYFSWVSGHGSFRPFLSDFQYAQSKYHPEFSGMDTTGAQKGIGEWSSVEYSTNVDGVNFGTNKDSMLNALSLIMSNHDLRIPPIKGVIRQLSTYKREDDRTQLAKVNQDIVMAMAMSAYFSYYTQESEKPQSSKVVRVSRKIRTNVRRSR